MKTVLNLNIPTVSAQSVADGAPRSVAPHHAIFDAVTEGNPVRLAALLRYHEVDLSAVEPASGQTALHLALTLGHTDIAAILVHHAGGDPEVIQARDRDGYTPIMCAVLLGNGPMVKALYQAGARAIDPSATLYFGPYHPSTAVTQERIDADIAVQFLSRAEGNITQAFELALQEGGDSMSAYLLYRAGADTRAVLEHFILAQRWELAEEIVSNLLIATEDLMAIMEQALPLPDRGLIQKLIAWDWGNTTPQLIIRFAVDKRLAELNALLDAMDTPLLTAEGRPQHNVESALLKLTAVEDLSYADKIAALRTIIHASAASPVTKPDFTFVIDPLVTAGKLKQVEPFFYAGVTMEPTMIRLAKAGDKAAVRGLEQVAAVALNLLVDNRDRSEKWLAAVSYAFLAKKLGEPQSVDEKIGFVRTVTRLGGSAEQGAIELLADKLRAGHMASVKLLIAGEVPTAGLLMDLARTRNRSLAGKLIATGGDIAGALKTLTTNVEIYTAGRKHEEARRESDAFNVLMMASVPLLSTSAATAGATSQSHANAQ